MNKKNTIIISGLAVAAVFSISLFFSSNDKNSVSDNIVTEKKASFSSLNSKELSAMLEKKDFKLVDVHTPEQKHIPGTDAFIPYDEIERIVEFLPNKNERVVLYCRSGSMSKIVADELIGRGYTNVFDLTKGLNEWVGEGRATVDNL